MARGFLYVYERIYKGETEMQTEFRKMSTMLEENMQRKLRYKSV